MNQEQAIVLIQRRIDKLQDIEHYDIMESWLLTTANTLESIYGEGSFTLSNFKEFKVVVVRDCNTKILKLATKEMLEECINLLNISGLPAKKEKFDNSTKISNTVSQSTTVNVSVRTTIKSIIKALDEKELQRLLEILESECSQSEKANSLEQVFQEVGIGTTANLLAGILSGFLSDPSFIETLRSLVG